MLRRFGCVLLDPDRVVGALRDPATRTTQFLLDSGTAVRVEEREASQILDWLGFELGEDSPSDLKVYPAD